MITPVTYIQALAGVYPDTVAISTGTGSIYEDLVHVSGPALPSKEDLGAHVRALNQAQVISAIKEMRDIRRAKGVPVGSNWYHSNDTSRVQFLGLVLMGANIPSGLLWKTMTGLRVPMTQSLANSIFVQIATQDTATFEVAEIHCANMLLAQDPLAYDFYSANASPAWPSVYTN